MDDNPIDARNSVLVLGALRLLFRVDDPDQHLVERLNEFERWDRWYLVFCGIAIGVTGTNLVHMLIGTWWP